MRYPDCRFLCRLLKKTRCNSVRARPEAITLQPAGPIPASPKWKGPWFQRIRSSEVRDGAVALGRHDGVQCKQMLGKAKRDRKTGVPGGGALGICALDAWRAKAWTHPAWVTSRSHDQGWGVAPRRGGDSHPPPDFTAPRSRLRRDAACAAENSTARPSVPAAGSDERGGVRPPPSPAQRARRRAAPRPLRLGAFVSERPSAPAGLAEAARSYFTCEWCFRAVACSSGVAALRLPGSPLRAVLRASTPISRPLSSAA